MKLGATPVYFVPKGKSNWEDNALTTNSYEPMIVLGPVNERRVGMAKARILNIMATECPSEDDAKFNKWYNEVHIPLLFKYRGLKKVTRYELMGNNGGQGAKYLAIYEYENKDEMNAFPKSPEFKTAIDEMNETWKGVMFVKWAANYEPIKTWEK
jgi:hypothetical protein